MGGMAVRDGSFLLAGAVFPIDCGGGRNTLADYTGVIEEAQLMAAADRFDASALDRRAELSRGTEAANRRTMTATRAFPSS